MSQRPRFRLLLLRWRIMWRHRPKPVRKITLLLARWRWESILSIGALGVLKIHEYAVALTCVAVSLIAITAKVYHWAGLPSKGWTATLKTGATSGILLIGLFLFIVVWHEKGAAEWSTVPDTIGLHWHGPNPPIP